jgi:hypothetical protein
MRWSKVHQTRVRILLKTSETKLSWGPRSRDCGGPSITRYAVPQLLVSPRGTTPVQAIITCIPPGKYALAGEMGDYERDRGREAPDIQQVKTNLIGGDVTLDDDYTALEMVLPPRDLRRTNW